MTCCAASTADSHRTKSLTNPRHSLLSIASILSCLASGCLSSLSHGRRRVFLLALCILLGLLVEGLRLRLILKLILAFFKMHPFDLEPRDILQLRVVLRNPSDLGITFENSVEFNVEHPVHAPVEPASVHISMNGEIFGPAVIVVPHASPGRRFDSPTTVSFAFLARPYACKMSVDLRQYLTSAPLLSLPVVMRVLALGPLPLVTILEFVALLAVVHWHFNLWCFVRLLPRLEALLLLCTFLLWTLLLWRCCAHLPNSRGLGPDLVARCLLWAAVPLRFKKPLLQILNEDGIRQRTHSGVGKGRPRFDCTT
mmetsp:Transcript_61925/g.164582  ORF Transcript_61925/g.164582 Transcript_61925/m.164582 type:complete len:311 (+) Transcript_61925:172-1104(+)